MDGSGELPCLCHDGSQCLERRLPSRRGAREVRRIPESSACLASARPSVTALCQIGSNFGCGDVRCPSRLGWDESALERYRRGGTVDCHREHHRYEYDKSLNTSRIHETILPTSSLKRHDTSGQRGCRGHYLALPLCQGTIIFYVLCIFRGYAQLRLAASKLPAGKNR